MLNLSIWQSFAFSCIKRVADVHNLGMKCVIVCVGSDKISGDSLGPMVGSLLRSRHVPCPVYGVEGCTVNGVNLPHYRSFLQRHYPNVPVIAVDAALGRPDEVGQIRYRLGGVQAGGALGRQEDGLGELAILGVVAAKCADPLGALLSVPFDEVESLAEHIADHVYKVLSAWEAAC